MRTTKYRGKIKYNGNHLFDGDWAYGSLIVKTNGVFIYVAEDDEFGNIVREYEVEVIPETVGQFTGLTDKNGKEIYDGDIVRWSTDIDEQYYGGHERFYEEEVKFMGGAFYPVCLMDSYEFEVIHDNPELL